MVGEVLDLVPGVNLVVALGTRTAAHMLPRLHQTMLSKGKIERNWAWRNHQQYILQKVREKKREREREREGGGGGREREGEREREGGREGGSE